MTQTPSAQPSGLSIGAKAGAGVGVALGVILVDFGICLPVTHKRKRPWKHSEREQSDLAAAKNLTIRHEVHELDSIRLYEKDGFRGARLPLQEPAELEGLVTR
jgi:hypothetical protein